MGWRCPRQESETDRRESENGEEEGGNGSSGGKREEKGGGGGGGRDEDSRRIGPWHPPDHKRQLKLATRLSNPDYRSTRSVRTVSPEELDTIIGRVTRPTVASRGGVDIMHKDFTYNKPPRLKTLPVIPGLDRRYMGLQHVSNDQLNDIVSRLTRMTSAYEAKFAQNRNVWVDMEPGAHIVRLRKGQAV
nr:hypothetical protein BaRGS_020747 [Batillaria attramentaria]